MKQQNNSPTKKGSMTALASVRTKLKEWIKQQVRKPHRRVQDRRFYAGGNPDCN